MALCGTKPSVDVYGTRRICIEQNAVAENTNCPSNLHRSAYLKEFGSSCYEFILDHPGDWYHAEKDCKSKDGVLVHIHSSSEQAFLFNSVQTLGFHHDKGVWIGLTDEPREGHWIWSSGDPLDFKNWATGQPGSLLGGLEDCVLMQFSDNGRWHDYACHGILFDTQNHGWICKYGTVAQSTMRPTTMPPSTMPPSTMAPSTMPPSTMPPSTMAPSTMPPSTMPPSTMAPSTMPPSTMPRSTMPPSTMPPSTMAPSTMPPSTMPPSTMAPSTMPPSTMPPSTMAPSTMSPSTMARSTMPPSTMAPSTMPPSTMQPATTAQGQ